MRALFIVNPAAGHGRARKRWLSVERDALAAAPGSDVRWTAAPGEAQALALSGVEAGFDAVIAVGGDGTFSEALNGFLEAEPAARGRCALGTWPAGSGCDLARHFGLSGRAGLLGLLERPMVRRLDAGLVEFSAPEGTGRRFFANVVTAGLGGEVARRVQREGKGWGGPLSYLLASAKEIARARPRVVSLVLDGEALPPLPLHLLAVANTSTTGGGMAIAPQADPFDGRLDWLAVEGLSRASLLARLPSVYAGTHLGRPGVRGGLVSRLVASSADEVWLNVDGEAVGRLPASFTALPAAVPFLLPG